MKLKCQVYKCYYVYLKTNRGSLELGGGGGGRNLNCFCAADNPSNATQILDSNLLSVFWVDRNAEDFFFRFVCICIGFMLKSLNMQYYLLGGF